MFERTFFITTVAHRRKPVFRSARLAQLFLDTLYSYRKQGRFLLHEFVLMPDHLHLMITPSIKIPMERAMQFIKGGFSHRATTELPTKMKKTMNGTEGIFTRIQCKRAWSRTRPTTHTQANSAFAVDPPPRG